MKQISWKIKTLLLVLLLNSMVPLVFRVPDAVIGFDDDEEALEETVDLDNKLALRES